MPIVACECKKPEKFPEVHILAGVGSGRIFGIKDLGNRLRVDIAFEGEKSDGSKQILFSLKRDPGFPEVERSHVKRCRLGDVEVFVFLI